MTNQLRVCTVLFALGSAGVVDAQTGSMDKGMMKGDAMTVTGCVAAGKTSGQFMLTNAMTGHDTMAKDTMAKDTMGKGTMAPGMGEHMMSYDLVGGDVKGHMGHKVEVTGTMSKADMDKMHKMGSMDQGDKSKMSGMADKDMPAMKLMVTSVKMISATCP